MTKEFTNAKKACQYMAEKLGVLIVAKAEGGGWIELTGLSGMHMAKVNGYDELYRDLAARWQRVYGKAAPTLTR